jgi:hypothetical protein
MSIAAIAALLTGCGAPLAPSTSQAAASRYSAAHSMTFRYTGAQQSFTVPAGVTQITVDASGAGGAGIREVSGGKGGLVKATIAVKPGEDLAVFVGGTGGVPKKGAGGAGGFNGGGAGGNGGNKIYPEGGCGGGGGSDVRQNGSGLTDRVVIAAGGGGAGARTIYGDDGGGAGGGEIGEHGRGYHRNGNPDGQGGGGGTQTNGGKGGRGGRRGPMKGGNGGRGALGLAGSGGTYIYGGGGGGGGGGYYGGGGGGAGSDSTSGFGAGGGGGGASSYVEPGATNVKNEQGAGASGDGKIVITW